MASLDRLKLRALSTQRLEHQGQEYAVLEDPLGVFTEPVLIPIEGYHWMVRHFDGETHLRDIQARVLRERGQLIPLTQLQSLVEQLDRAMVLDGPAFAAFHEYLLGGRREFSIVPILVGSLHDLMEAEIDPIESAEVRRFVKSLRAAESASGKKVMYIGGIDLCHVGPEFGDPELLDAATLDQVRTFDTTMLDCAAASDPAGWFGTAARVGNRWRVCGLEASYTMLHAMGPSRGRLLKYDQAVDDLRTCCVRFASLAFDPSDDADAEVRNRA